jgi:hypothetical protein
VGFPVPNLVVAARDSPQAVTGTTDKAARLLRTDGNDKGSVCKPAAFFNSLL